MPTADVDTARILSVLEEHNVQYVIIGGFAAELHRVAIAPTRDIDLTPAATDDNLARLAAALQDLNARFRVLDGPPEGVEIPGGITAGWLAEMVTVTLSTDAGALDIALRPDGTDGYDDLHDSLSIVDHEGYRVPVASLADVIRSKEAAGREKDLLVLPALKAHLRRSSR
jgi:predicted nucleotidyltransferase